VILGKTATPEFGLTTSTESTLHGQTRNPWNLEYTSGGSSGGSSAAVAARILPAAHATDGGGSIRIPASCCGLFGLKPSRARVSMAPDAGEGWSGLSTLHAITRSVRDSAALLDAVAGPAQGDPYWAPPPARPYLQEVGAPPGTLRIGVTTVAFSGVKTHPECAQAAHDAARLSESLGHHVFETALELPTQEIAAATNTIIGANVLSNVRERVAKLGRDYTQDDLEPVTHAMVERSKSSSASDYAFAVRAVHRVGRLVAQRFADLDVLLTPTMAAPPKRLGVLALTRTDGDGFRDQLMETTGFTMLMNVAGCPAASVPLHWSAEGLPVGVQIAAAYGREDVLFRLAAQLEQARPWSDKRPPGF
jgi:Asp-tRNA(Asn)/Glu-tRNA(Gln) amidotransferase A subunit family amidase